MSCRDRVLDVFVTNGDSDYRQGYDDTFVGPVWSVRMEEAGERTATVVNAATDWVTFCQQEANGDDVNVGDLVRFGNATSDGHTDYVTILERKKIISLHNGVADPNGAHQDLKMYKDSDGSFRTMPRLGGVSSTGVLSFFSGLDVYNQLVDDDTVTMTATMFPSDSNGATPPVFTAKFAAGTTYHVINASGNSFKLALAAGGTAITFNTAGVDVRVHRVANWDTDPSAITPNPVGLLHGDLGASIDVNQWAYRLNFSINLTQVPEHWYLSAASAADKAKHIVKWRHKTMQGPTSLPTKQRLYYPMYKVNKWLTNNGDISVSLDHGVKSLHWIKLVAYSVFNKRQVGFQAAHEMEQDDWVAMHVNEVEGGVVSNNPSANGAFCVLHVGGAKDNETGAVEYHAHDPQGLYTHYFDNHNSTIRNLNLRFLDRKGNAAHFGRIHLWFKLCVQHG